MFICLPQGHPRCRWLCFFSRTQTKIFNSNRCSLSVITYTKHTQTKLNPVARDDTLRSKDMKRSVCARSWTVFIYFFLPLFHRTVQLSWARSQQLAVGCWCVIVWNLTGTETCLFNPRCFLILSSFRDWLSSACSVDECYKFGKRKGYRFSFLPPACIFPLVLQSTWTSLASELDLVLNHTHIPKVQGTVLAKHTEQHAWQHL